jgi:hypothetical protein
MKVYVILLRDWDKMQSGIYMGKAFRSEKEAELFLVNTTGLTRKELFPGDGGINSDEFSIEELTIYE